MQLQIGLVFKNDDTDTTILLIIK